MIILFFYFDPPLKIDIKFDIEIKEKALIVGRERVTASFNSWYKK